MQTMPLGARIGFGRGHMFWEPARGPHAARLGQTVYKDPSNRLLEQTLVDILRRRLMVVLPEGESWRAGAGLAPSLYRAGWPGKIDPAAFGYLLEPPWQAGVPTPTPLSIIELVSPFQAGPTGAFYDVSQAPTSEELDDADRIDAFFGPAADMPFPSMGDPLYPDFSPPDPWITQPCLDGYFYHGHRYGTFKKINTARSDPRDPDFNAKGPYDMTGRFWCSPWAEGRDRALLPGAVMYAWPPGGVPGTSSAPGGSVRAYFWGLTLSEPWGQVKPWFKNAQLADYVLSRYPFPAPFGEYTRFWSYFALPGLRDLIKTPVDLAEEDIRVWITFSVLAHYNEMVDALNSYLKAQAKSERQDQLITIIAVAVLGVMTLLAGLPAIIAAIANSAVSAMNKIDQHKFQEDMAGIQDAFKSTDPAFAGQVGEAAAYVARLSKALETAVDKSTVQRTLASTSLSTGLMIGGGLAAIGALALALFRK